MPQKRYTSPLPPAPSGLRTWGAAHRGLWDTLRKRGQPGHVVTAAREKRAEKALENYFLDKLYPIRHLR